MKEVHRHDFKKLGFVREVGIDRVILTRNCACGENEAFACGPKDEMRTLYTKIKKQREKQKNETQERRH